MSYLTTVINHSTVAAVYELMCLVYYIIKENVCVSSIWGDFEQLTEWKPSKKTTRPGNKE